MMLVYIIVGYFAVCLVLLFTNFDEWMPTWMIFVVFFGWISIAISLIGISDWWNKHRGIPIRYI